MMVLLLHVNFQTPLHFYFMSMRPRHGDSGKVYVMSGIALGAWIVGFCHESAFECDVVN